MAKHANIGHFPHVVIIGGGFGGLYAARALKRVPVRLTLIDRRNHHLFQPLLYEVATAALDASDIAYPIRVALRWQHNARVILATATAIDTQDKKVILDNGDIFYDYLIVATGATHSYFGHDDWAPYAPGLKSIEDAFEIRRRVLLAYEAAERELDPERRPRPFRVGAMRRTASGAPWQTNPTHHFTIRTRAPWQPSGVLRLSRILGGSSSLGSPPGSHGCPCTSSSSSGFATVYSSCSRGCGPT